LVQEKCRTLSALSKTKAFSWRHGSSGWVPASQVWGPEFITPLLPKGGRGGNRERSYAEKEIQKSAQRTWIFVECQAVQYRKQRNPRESIANSKKHISSDGEIYWDI
jgi:hypothetical protein